MPRSRIVPLVALFAALLALPLVGCSSSGKKRDPMVSTEIVNASTHTVRTSLHIGDRVRLEGRPVLPRQDGRPVEIARGKSEALRIRRPREAVIFGTKPDEELVYWLRTEIITASWDDEAVFWFELLGPPAEQITIRNATARGATGLIAESASVPIKALAPELYPMRDRNYAFELPGGN
ncbi:MAG: hypothetical protein LAT64_04450 [Phycisphaerales bacterium]|nr:hypothetical protein [Planctomycetota bacterium]MCH8508004.1 hypothetical protein [Phycisphaerales bacterium]